MKFYKVLGFLKWSGTLDSHSAVFVYEVGHESINNLGGAIV